MKPLAILFLLLTIAAPARAQNGNYVADGDSITACFGVPTCWTSQLSPSGSWAVTNMGRNGELLLSMWQDAPTRIDPLYVPGKLNVVTIWGGTNDLNDRADLNVNVVESILQSYVADRVAVGWRVIIVYMLSRGGNSASGGTNEANKDLYNAWMLANWKNIGASGLAVLDPLLTADGACANAMYFQGGCIHPNQFSDTNIVAPDISANINALPAIGYVRSVSLRSRLNAVVSSGHFKF